MFYGTNYIELSPFNQHMRQTELICLLFEDLVRARLGHFQYQ